MYRLVSSIVKFLCARGGHKYFTVWEYVIKTEYQGRKTAHWHIAMWVTCHGILQNLAGRTNTGQVSPFVRFLQLVSRCDIDVQVGNGRLNYIDGYISKDHDAVDVSLGEYTQKNVMSNRIDCCVRRVLVFQSVLFVWHPCRSLIVPSCTSCCILLNLLQWYPSKAGGLTVMRRCMPNICRINDLVLL